MLPRGAFGRSPQRAEPRQHFPKRIPCDNLLLGRRKAGFRAQAICEHTMKIIRYRDSTGQIHFGRRHDEGRAIRLDGDLFGALRDTGEPADVQKLLAPLEPREILCIGLNYRKHAEEGGKPIPTQPVLFMKNIGSVQNPEDPILLPRRLRSDMVDYECELAIVIGRPCKNVSKADALHYVLGYTCANDVSARDWQMHWGGGQWCRGKTFATFCPLGPAIVTPDEIPNPNSLGIKTILNGATMQDWNTGDMIFDVPTLIEFLSGSTLLGPGTVILTGTPHGVGAVRKPPVFLQPGDRVTIEIERIGALSNPVAEESDDG
jgi:2-keto-4-pentenoate hydratase/2-oxohepta-3-ene-1,7-dioic acid hydratase in catechol pathway